MLYPRVSSLEASPKAISGRTSYIRVRLEFLRYPHVIRQLFNGGRFGPPLSFTSTSTCTWIGHPVSGRLHVTLALFTLGFPTAPYQKYLTSLHTITRRTVLQKVPHRTQGALCACKHKVSGSLSLPARGSFHLSFTVLFTIGHWRVFRLGGWSPHLPTGFHVSGGTLDTARCFELHVRDSHTLWFFFP